jgi:hypothetical protein
MQNTSPLATTGDEQTHYGVRWTILKMTLVAQKLLYFLCHFYRWHDFVMVDQFVGYYRWQLEDEEGEG